MPKYRLRQARSAARRSIGSVLARGHGRASIWWSLSRSNWIRSIYSFEGSTLFRLWADAQRHRQANLRPRWTGRSPQSTHNQHHRRRRIFPIDLLLSLEPERAMRRAKAWLTTLKVDRLRFYSWTASRKRSSPSQQCYWYADRRAAQYRVRSPRNSDAMVESMKLDSSG